MSAGAGVPGGAHGPSGRAPALALALLVALVVLVAYVDTTCRTVAAGDSGEYAAVVGVRGVAHPPGYPLLTVLGIAAEVGLPFGEPAFRVNLVSALCGALAAGLLVLVASRLTGCRAAAVTAALLYAFAPVPWMYAGVAEVFALNVALALGATLLVLRLGDRLRAGAGARFGDAGRLAAGTGLVFGLGMSNHHTTVLVLLAALAHLGVEVASRRIPLRPALGALGWAVLGGATGLLVYLYLPLAASADPPVAWGDTGTWDGFVHHLLRRDFGTLNLVTQALASSEITPLTHPLFFLGRFGPHTAFLGPALVLLGVLALAGWFGTRPARGTGLVVLALVATGPVFLALFNAPLEPEIFRGVVERFYILPEAFAAVLAAVGLAAVLSWLPAGRPRTLAALLLPLAVGGLQYARHHERADWSDNRFSLDYSTDLLACVPEGAVLFGRSDLATNTLEYQQYVLGRRRDAAIVDQEKLTYPWFAEHARGLGVAIPGERYDGVRVRSLELIEANAGRPVLFFDFKDAAYEERWVAERRGLLWQVVPRGAPTPLAEQFATNAALWDGFSQRSLHLGYGEETFEREGVRRYAEMLFHLGWLAEQIGRFDEAVRSYRRCTELDPVAHAPFRNLGIVLERLGRVDEAVDALAEAVRRQEPGPDRDAIAAHLEQLRLRAVDGR